jgi:hypothetical protein
MGVAAKLGFSTNPTDNLAVQPVVTAYDSGNGAPAPDFTGNVLITITSTGDSNSLYGTVTKAAVASVATFTDLQIPANGTYTLTATDTTPGTSITPAVSHSFTMSHRTELHEIRKNARFRLGISPNGDDEDSTYTSMWPTAVTQARNFVTRELVQSSYVQPRTTVEVPLVASQREYDLTSLGLLNIDSVEIGTSTSRSRMIPYGESQALFSANGDLSATGKPYWYYMAGANQIGVVPLPSGTTDSLWVTGSPITDAMSSPNDLSGISEMFNDAIAVKSALDVAGSFDMEQPEHGKRLPMLIKEFEAIMTQMKTLLDKFTPKRGGAIVAGSHSDAIRRGYR